MRYNEIANQVKQVIQYSQNFNNVNVEDLMNKWEEAKSDFIRYFGGKLIYETSEKISVTINEEDQEEEIRDLLSQICEILYAPELAEFIMENKETFFDNITSKSYKINGKKIPTGIKITKAFKYFVSDPIMLDMIQTLASRTIQKGKISGYLCLSVHPLDYLSSSENTSNWRSCHALNGDYRAGNLSYMCDKSTVVCYIRGTDYVKLPRFPESVPWNNKKWRMLLFVSDNWNALFAGRHYPFFSEELMDKVREIWNKRLPYMPFTNWHNDYFKQIHFNKHSTDDFSTYDRYVPIQGHLYAMKKLVTDDSTKLHFNDLLNSSTYIPYYCWRQDYLNPKEPNLHFQIGSKVKCLCCNSDVLTNHESMFCPDCDGYEVCYTCGKRIDVDYAYRTAYGYYVCSDCYDSDFFTCCNCEGIFKYDDEIYDSSRDINVCRDCYYELNEF